jgi:hypothetical protein
MPPAGPHRRSLAPVVGGAGEWTQLFLRRRDALTHGGRLRKHLAVVPRFSWLMAIIHELESVEIGDI